MHHRTCCVNWAFASVWLIASASLFAAEARPVRVAVIGGMVETGFWNALAQRFEESTGLKVVVVASGTSVSEPAGSWGTTHTGYSAKGPWSIVER